MSSVLLLGVLWNLCKNLVKLDLSNKKNIAILSTVANEVWQLRVATRISRISIPRLLKMQEFHFYKIWRHRKFTFDDFKSDALNFVKWWPEWSGEILAYRNTISLLTFLSIFWTWLPKLKSIWPDKTSFFNFHIFDHFSEN